MIQINAIGDACPLPVIKTKKELSAIENGQLEVLVDNEAAAQNVCRFAEAQGCQVSLSKKDSIFHVVLIKGFSHPQGSDSIKETGSVKTIVVLSADVMGNGDDELGRSLMKGFIFALTQLDILPNTVLLYNTGAKLAVQGANTLADLITLEKAGVTIRTCGACLNYFGITEQLGVGEITNMYNIVEEMRDAQRTLRP